MAQVRLHSISKSFADTQVIQDLDIDIADGEFLTLVGPSGCGKSTLLRIIAGLEEQTLGNVLIADDNVDAKRPSERDLAMVFQSYALYPHLTVFDNIAVPLRMHWLNTWQRLPYARWLVPGTRQREAEIKARVEEASEILGLQKFLDRKPGQLSGGQRQRVAVGRAIVRHPAAFLFDEPLSNLDAKLRVHMRAEITHLHRQLKATFIYVTHDQAEAMTMSDRIAVMMEGELVQVGAPDEVYLDPQDVRVAEFIGSPKINLLPGKVAADGQLQVFGHSLPAWMSEDQGDTVQIGVRPENLRVANDDGMFSGVVQLVENLGAEYFVHLEVEGVKQELILRLNHDAAGGIQLDDRLSLSFDPWQTLVFGSDGKRVAMKVAAAEVVYA